MQSRRFAGSIPQTGASRLRRGFTLLEILIVLVIIGVIAGMAVPRLLDSQKKALIDTTKIELTKAKGTLDLFAKDHFVRFPEAKGQSV